MDFDIVYNEYFPFWKELSKEYKEVNCVMVPIGQYTHHDRGLNNTMVIRPSIVEVSMML